MGKHTISADDLANFAFRQEVAGSYGKGENKKLELVVREDVVRYEVFDHKSLVGVAFTLVEAVEIYNKV